MNQMMMLQCEDFYQDDFQSILAADNEYEEWLCEQRMIEAAEIEAWLEDQNRRLCGAY